MSQQTVNRSSVRAAIKWSKLWVRHRTATRPVRRAQAKMLGALAKESELPFDLLCDAGAVLLATRPDGSARFNPAALDKPDAAAGFLDAAVELVRSPGAAQAYENAIAGLGMCLGAMGRPDDHASAFEQMSGFLQAKRSLWQLTNGNPVELAAHLGNYLRQPAKKPPAKFIDAFLGQVNAAKMEDASDQANG